MTFTITKGMAGKRIETIGKYKAPDIRKMYVDFYNWKQDPKTKSKHHIASYERHLINNDKHIIVIDFGSYTHFGLIRANKAEWNELMNYRAKPINLDV